MEQNRWNVLPSSGQNSVLVLGVEAIDGSLRIVGTIFGSGPN